MRVTVISPIAPALALAAALCAGAGLAARGQGFAPHEAAGKMQTAPGLRVRLFASEPEVRDPILVKCDHRGRVWTIQYLQYPNPAGLTRVKVDRWSRTVYDRVPEPPPRGPRGADRITICEDTDGDGRADRFRDFVDGLNLVTGLEFGYGGVFVLQVPYLLFYPDRDYDDVPDADPEVLLSGFGMEDAQSLANHLTFGPDGWLYGVNGSTTTCKIRGVEFQQGLWRYHPGTRQFELFCEGGANTFGVTFDDHGEAFYSTNGGPFVHAVQGGYFYKSFGKHGPVHNPYAYHYFPPLVCDNVPGGPPTGGTIYRGDTFPPQFRGKFVAGNFLGHTASWWHVDRAATTFAAKYGGTVLDAKDTWFGPTDMCLAPDGAMYVCDFHDARTAHPDPDAQWDHTNGRIYRIEAEAAHPAATIDVTRLESSRLVDLLAHANGWYVDRARRELALRGDAAVVPRLRGMALGHSDERAALEGLWALHGVAGLDDPLASELLEHPAPYVRSWTVRLLGDGRSVSPPIAAKLSALAETEPSPIVRLQLAATAKRLPGPDGLPIVERLLARNLDSGDERITWLLWWAIEDKALSDSARLLSHFATAQAWDNPFHHDNIRRLVRRYAAEGSAVTYGYCWRLIDAAPADMRRSLDEHLNQGLAERARALPDVGQGDLFAQQAVVPAGAEQPPRRGFDPLDQASQQRLAGLWEEHRGNPLYTELALRAGIDLAYEWLESAVQDADAPAPKRAELLTLLREFGRPGAVPGLLKLVTDEQPDTVRLAALDALSRFDAPAIAEVLVGEYRRLPEAVQARARDVLLGRAASARAFLALVEAGKLSPQDVPIEQLRRIGLLGDADLNEMVRKHWGNVGPGTTEEKLATMRRFNNDLRPAPGDPINGKVLFAKHCGTCHQLRGEGQKIGPDLTTANRNDRAALLANIVDPSAVIRREYLNFVVQTTSGQILTGLLAEQDAASVTVLDAKNQRTRVPRNEIESLEEATVSLMPEKILETLTPQELRDLFSYLEQ